MKKIKINGGKELKGTIKISGAKNSAVALVPASLLSDGIVTIDNIPNISDIDALNEILEYLGAKVTRVNDRMIIDQSNLENKEIPEAKAKKLRASYYFMSALLGKYKKVEMYFPGGCSIGARPIDQTLKGYRALGANVVEEGNKFTITAEELIGAEVSLDMPSVGATVNTMLAAVKAKGVTTILNAAKEPEIVNVATFLNNMGAKITGAGTSEITIKGVSKLGDGFVEVIPDRIEAGTYLAFAAANGNGVLVKNVITEHLDPFIAKLQEMGVRLEIHEDSIYVPGGDLLVPVTVKTAPFPGFATDLQQPLTPLLLKAQGSSRIIDTLYPERVKHIPEMRKMGAKISSKDGIITVKRSKDLLGTTVEASEIRAGVSLLGLALMAEGTTVITKADNILRGYDRIVDKLKGLSVKVEIITDNRE